MSTFPVCVGYPRVQRVQTFDELISTPFVNGINALNWKRTLLGDFSEVVRRLERDHGLESGITALDADCLRDIGRSPSFSDAGRIAIEEMLTDLQLLQQHGLDPELNAVNGFLRDANPGPVRTDVGSFHVDSATMETDTWLCTYHGMPSEGLRHEDALRRVDVTETRAELLKLYAEECADDSAAADDESFEEWLSENCYDLHYAPMSGTQPFSFGIGNLWRIATKWPGCAVPPCIHRAPEVEAGDGVRLLLIG
jgi:hypothetical protein